MAIKRGTQDIKSIFRGDTPVKKVYRGTTLIWQKWTLKTGLLYNMTSRTTPAPFVVQAESGYGERWRAFNNVSGDEYNPQLQSSVSAYIDVVVPVKVKKIRYRIYNSSYFNPTVWFFEGSNDLSTWDVLWSYNKTAPGTLDQTPEIDTDNAYRYYRARGTATGNTEMKMNMVLITEWYEQG